MNTRNFSVALYTLALMLVSASASAQQYGDVDSTVLRELEAAFGRLQATPSHRLTMVLPQSALGDAEFEMDPLVMEKSGDLMRFSMNGRGEGGAIAIEAVTRPDKYAFRFRSEELEEAMRDMESMPRMPGMGGAGGTGSAVATGALAFVQSGFNPLGLMAAGFSVAERLMSSAMLGGIPKVGKWSCEDLSEAASGDTAEDQTGSITEAARLGEETVDGKLVQTYRLVMVQDGETVDGIVYIDSDSGLPHQMELVSPDIDGTVLLTYTDFGATSITFPSCN